MLTSLIIALISGFIAYIVAVNIPFTQAYANAIGIIVAILVFLSRHSL